MLNYVLFIKSETEAVAQLVLLDVPYGFTHAVMKDDVDDK